MANFVPWQQIAKRTGATFRPIPVDGSGELQLDTLDEIASEGSVKVVANNLVSNALWGGPGEEGERGAVCSWPSARRDRSWKGAAKVGRDPQAPR